MDTKSLLPCESWLDKEFFFSFLIAVSVDYDDEMWWWFRDAVELPPSESVGIDIKTEWTCLISFPQFSPHLHLLFLLFLVTHYTIFFP